jgi:hypothetical protein
VGGPGQARTQAPRHRFHFQGPPPSLTFFPYLLFFFLVLVFLNYARVLDNNTVSKKTHTHKLTDRQTQALTHISGPQKKNCTEKQNVQELAAIPPSAEQLCS